MSDWEQLTKKLVELMGFGDFHVEVKTEEKRCSIFIYDLPDFLKTKLPDFVESLNHIGQLVAKKKNEEPIFFDINNYRQERESLISELAKAAAKKASSSKEAVSLPPMNSYERRIVHMALAVHPDVKTESAGEGKERYVIVKPVE